MMSGPWDARVSSSNEARVPSKVSKSSLRGNNAGPVSLRVERDNSGGPYRTPEV
jgi:hypothetical protein